MAKSVARAVLFDLGNVLVRWSPLRLYERLFPTLAQAEKFLADIDWAAWHVRHDKGEPFAVTSAELISRFPHYRVPIEAWFGRWEEMFDGYVPGVPEIMRDLQYLGAPLFALTNLPDEVAARTFALFPAMTAFQDIVVSGAEKCVKPDPAIYQIALQRIGRDAPEVFFTDDSPANIAAAQALGFQTHAFAGAPGLAAALRQAGFALDSAH